jgi:hypothetical protein
MIRTGEVRDNSAMKGLFSSLKPERKAGKVLRTREHARTEVSTTSSGSIIGHDAT